MTHHRTFKSNPLFWVKTKSYGSEHSIYIGQIVGELVMGFSGYCGSKLLSLHNHGEKSVALTVLVLIIIVHHARLKFAFMSEV